MTFYELTPSLWALMSFALFTGYLLLDTKAALSGVAASLFSFCASVLGLSMLVQSVTFFLYFAVLLLLLCGKRLRHIQKSHEISGYAIALSAIDAKGGTVYFRGENYKIVSRDPYLTFARGDILSVKVRSDGTLCATRCK